MSLKTWDEVKFDYPAKLQTWTHKQSNNELALIKAHARINLSQIMNG